MMSLTRKAGYGLVAMAHLAHRPGQYVSAREIARENHLPVSLVMKVLKRLCVAGYVESIRGAGGGYCLSVSPEDILLGPLLDEIDGLVRDSRCRRDELGLEPRPPGQLCPDTNTCRFANPIHLIHRKLRDFLQNVSLADIMGRRSGTPYVTSAEEGENQGPKETVNDA